MKKVEYFNIIGLFDNLGFSNMELGVANLLSYKQIDPRVLISYFMDYCQMLITIASGATTITFKASA